MNPGDSKQFGDFARETGEWIREAVGEAMPHGAQDDIEYQYDSGAASYTDPYYQGKEVPKGPFQSGFEGIGPRPKHWPPHMSWPPSSVRKAMDSMTPGERDQVIKGLQERSEAMRLRSKQIHDWFVERGNRTRLRRPVDHPTYGVMFASMLSPSGIDSSLTSSVLSWGHRRVTTQDGGIVAASENGIRAVKATQQAAQVLVMEARARGWDCIDVTGTSEFKRMVAMAAQQYGMPVYSRNILGQRRVLASGMVPPPPDAEMKRRQYRPENDPGAPTARRKAGTLEVEAAAAAAVVAGEAATPRVRPAERQTGSDRDPFEEDPHGAHSTDGYDKIIDHDPNEGTPKPDSFRDPNDLPPPPQF